MDPAVRSFLSTGATAGSHLGLIVQDDAFLTASVTEWTIGALQEGGGAILVGTASHLEQIRTQCRARGSDIDGAERQGRAVLIDADWLLAKFMLDGSPNAQKFVPLLEEILTQMVRVVGSPSKVRAWGEMVSLLRARDNGQAALRLEALWEDSLQQHGFSLLCSYHTGHAELRPSAEMLRDVAHTHPSWLPQPTGAPSMGF